MCKHERLVDGYYGHDCADCGVLVYAYGCEPWIDDPGDEETDGCCAFCGGEWGDGWSTCACEDDAASVDESAVSRVEALFREKFEAEYGEDHSWVKRWKAEQ